METSLLKKLQKKGSGDSSGPTPEGGLQDGLAMPMRTPQGKSSCLSSKLFKRLRKEGHNERLAEKISPRRTARTHAGQPSGDGEMDHLKSLEDDVEPTQIRFHAGQRVDPEKPLQESRRSAKNHGVSIGWDTTVAMFEDLGWDHVFERVETFVRNLSLTEVAKEFAEDRSQVVKAILEGWEDGGPDESILRGPYDSMEEAARALVAYVESFYRSA